MKSFQWICLLFLISHPPVIAQLWLEAEAFELKGGWVVDQQSMDVMGSPYLMAHGMGSPVEDARTRVLVPKSGTYHIWIRTRDWSAPWSEESAGQFSISVNGELLKPVFGTRYSDWSWIDGGSLKLKKGEAEVSLHDLTGFNGRCDAIYFTTNPDDKPPHEAEELKAFRLARSGHDDTPEELAFDFVVVGGGMAGTCAAISAARLGVKVALVQNRPVLGGNNSSEVRVHLGARIRLDPYPALGNLVNEIGPVEEGNARRAENYQDEKKLQAVLNEPNISLFLNHHANEVITDKGQIRTVIAEHIETGKKMTFSAPLFADCTGDGSIGYLAGAEYMSGRESREVYQEPTAPEEADGLTMGISVQWYAEKQEEACDFPDIAWGLPWDEEKVFAIRRGDWDWETGMGKDMVKEAEQIRDYGLLVVYSNWSFLKNHYSGKEAFQHEKLKWVAHIGGKRESRRLVGDYVLTENDIVERNFMPDGTASTSWTIDLHYPDPENEAMFDGKAFRSIARHIPIHPYPIPFRCLYSRNVNNLMMAGRDISVSHVALGTVRLMRTGGMMGEVLGMAAAVCKEKEVLPRGLYQEHLPALQDLMIKGVGDPDLPNSQNYNLGGTLMKEIP